MNIQEILEQHKIYLESFGEIGYKADLRGADLRDANLCGANLRNANLCSANLRGANLRGADLCSANLCSANLRNANLCGADLYGADLRGADLRDANLCNADLRNANLRNADLRNADLRGADLRDANLCGANLPESTFIIVGENYFISITNGESVRAGCQSHSIEEWRKFTKEQIADMDGSKALKFYPRLLDIIDFYIGKGERPDWVKNSK